MKELGVSDMGRAVRDRRRALGLSQEDLALLAGVSRRPITLVESNKGDLRLSTLEAILKPLGLRVILAPIAKDSTRLTDSNHSEGKGE